MSKAWLLDPALTTKVWPNWECYEAGVCWLTTLVDPDGTNTYQLSILETPTAYCLLLYEKRSRTRAPWVVIAESVFTSDRQGLKDARKTAGLWRRRLQAVVVEAML